MSTEALIGVVLAPALAFGVAYHPILARLSLALVSPYAKADVVKRASAATIDGLLVALTIVLYRNSDMPFFLFLGGTYLLLRDSMSGRSIGKFCCGLVVVNLDDRTSLRARRLDQPERPLPAAGGQHRGGVPGDGHHRPRSARAAAG